MVLLLLMVVSCSSGSGDAETSTPSTTSVPSERSTLTDALDKVRAADSATMTFTLGGDADEGAVSQTIEGQFDFSTPAATSVTSGGGPEVTLIVDGDRSWLRYDLPEFDALLPEGTTWIEAPTDELAKRGVLSVNPDVTWAPLYLLYGAENIEVDDSGRTYTFDIDPSAIRPALTADQRKAFDPMLGGLLDPEVVVDATGTVTLDSEGRIVAYRAEIEVDNPSSRTNPTFVLELTLADFGLPVTVEPPPADQVANVADHPELLDQLSGPGPGY